jgi:hypothetical protein
VFIDIAPPLTDADAELLENEFSAIADQVGAEGVEVAGVVEDGIELIASFMIYYEDDRDDDEELARQAEKILTEFRRLQAQGEAMTRGYGKARARIGVLKLTLDRDGV